MRYNTLSIVLSFVLSAFLSTCLLASGAEGEPPLKLRVLSYNIHIGIGTDNKLDIERTARAIIKQQPDLVALQEVDRLTERVENMDQIEELARLTKMNVIFGKTVDLASGDYGIAIMSRFPIREHKMTQLPQREKEENRGVLSALIAVNNQTTLRFLCTHFCHIHEERRIRQAEKINELFAQDDVPSVLSGDFNAVPESQTLKTFLSKWEDSTDRTPTFPSSKSKIDYILYRPKGCFKVIETNVIEESVTSDHYPILSVLEFTPRD